MSKCVTLSDDAYNDLEMLKGERESFSEVVRRLVAKKKNSNLMKLSGIWKENSDMSKIMKDIYKNRKNINLRQ